MVLINPDAGIFSIKIEVGTHFKANKEDYYIVLREPTTSETLVLSKKENDGQADQQAMFDLMPQMIIEHNFQKPSNAQDPQSKPVKMNNKEVWAEIERRVLCATEVVNEWANNIPLAKGKLEK